MTLFSGSEGSAKCFRIKGMKIFPGKDGKFWQIWLSGWWAAGEPLPSQTPSPSCHTKLGNVKKCVDRLKENNVNMRTGLERGQRGLRRLRVYFFFRILLTFREIFCCRPAAMARNSPTVLTNNYCPPVSVHTHTWSDELRAISGKCVHTVP